MSQVIGASGAGAGGGITTITGDIGGAVGPSAPPGYALPI